MEEGGAKLVLADGVYIEVRGTGERASSLGIEALNEDDLAGGLADKVGAASTRLASTILQFGRSLQDSVQQLECAEVTVEFGVGIKAEIAIPYVTSNASEGSVKVVMKWTPPPTQ
jgi:hypothetical protein